MSSLQWRFADFRLDPDTACLWRGTQALALTPKAFAVLHYLVTHPDRLVSKDELLDAVWPETAISDAVVRIAIGEVRRALGDTAQAPRFIATVHRWGYRFVAPVTIADISANTAVTPAPQVSLPSAPPPLLVGREPLLQRLREAWAQARHKHRQVVWVTGEAGMGKTTVVEALRAEIATDPAVWLAAGQCVEYYGTGEAYLPVLEALGQLCRGAGGARLVPLLRQHAPTWLVQLPWLLTETDRERWRNELQGATRERMLREFAEVVDTLTAETPLVLLFEDLHWSDYATVDLLALLARRRTPAHLLVVGTYRPVEAIVSHHPLRTVVPDLQRHGYATELPLTLLSAEAVVAYLVARFPQQRFPAVLAPWLHQRTDGQPLFLVTLVQALVERNVLREQDGRWTVQGDIAALTLDVPESLRQLLEQQIARLPSEVQRVLEVASVAGVEFAAAAVAAGLEADTAMVEEHCEALVGQQFLRPLGVTTWPNSTLATRYTFRHALYQQGVYQRLGVGRRVRLHQRLGAYLEAAYGPHVGEIAAELAEHFVRGQDMPRAVHYLAQAAEKAAQRYAHREVIDLLTRALALLTQLPETPARAQQELAVQLALGPAMMATTGPGAPEVAQTYARARVLAAQVGEAPQGLPTLWGLWRLTQSRGALPTARELAEQLVRGAARTGDPTHRVQAHDALGATLFQLGAYAAAWRQFAQALALCDPTTQRDQALHNVAAPGVRCLVVGANALWCLGFPTQAAQRCQEALALAQALAHPYSLVVAQHFAAFLHCHRREVPAVQAQAETLLALATAQGFPLYAGYGHGWRGWARAMQGAGAAGLAEMHQGLTLVVAAGQELARPLWLVRLGEAVGHGGQVAEGRRLLAEALAAFAASGRGDLLAEAHRLQGELWLRQSPPETAQADACFQQALAIARQQQARSWELRAALSLSRLWQQQGKDAEARDLLAPIYGWFTEGFETVDLQEAQVLLAQLAG